MKVQLNPITLIKALLKDDEWTKEHPTFEVDPEIVKLAKLHAEIWLERWKEGTQEHWLENQERDNYIGLIGQKCFEITLEQLEIPYTPNDPVIDWRGKKDYDFRIPFIETVEVKTTDWKETQKRCLVKCSEWHDSDYVFAVKLLNEEPTKVEFAGYATKKEVNESFTYAENEFPCFVSPCYWRFLKELHSASEFFNMLRQKTEKLWNRTL